MFQYLPRWVPAVIGLAVSVGAAYLHLGGFGSSTPTTPADFCADAQSMAARDYGTSANGSYTKFEGVAADCAAKRLTMHLTVAASSRQLSEAGWSTVASSMDGQLCGPGRMRSLMDNGWTVATEYLLTADQVSKTLLVSCKSA